MSSDEEINELLTRSKEEEVLFAEMDRERLSRSQGQHVTPLMSESEVPEWAVAPPEEEEEKEDVPLGPRKAKSKQVRFVYFICNVIAKNANRRLANPQQRR